MTARLLKPPDLALHCDPADLQLEAACGDALEPAQAEIVGQERARAAIEFAVAMRRPGYHLFVMGPPGSGKRSLVRHVIDAHVAHDGIHRYDWVYVNNFERPHQPIALQLAAGHGAKLRADMRALVDELRTTIPAAFESEEYAAELERLNTDFKERAEGGLIEVRDEAQRRGLVMIRTPVGFTFAPQKGAEVMSPQDFEALSQEDRTRLQRDMSELQEQLVRVLRASMRLRKEHADRLRTLNRSTTKLAVDHVVDEMKARYAQAPAVCAHLEAVRTAVIENAEAFRAHEDGDAAAQQGELASLRGQPGRRRRRQRRRDHRRSRPAHGPEPGGPDRPHRPFRHARHRLPPHQGRVAAPRQRRLPAGRRDQAADATLRLERAEARPAAQRDPHRIAGRDVQHDLDDPARAAADSARRQGRAGRRARDLPAAADPRPRVREAVPRRRRSGRRPAARGAHAAGAGAHARFARRARRPCCRRVRRRWRA